MTQLYSSTRRIKALARFFGAAFRVNLKAAMEYRANFLLQVFGMALNNAAFALFWQFLLTRTGPLGGYGFRDIMIIWAITSAVFGLTHVVFGNVRQLGRMVKEGDLDTFLLQPKDTLLSMSISRTVVSGWGDILYSIVVLAILGLSWQNWIAFGVFLICGTLIMASSLVLVESLGFWLKGTEGLGQTMIELLLNFGLYPDSIFPNAMRWIFYSLVPTGIIVFIPLGLLGSWNWALAALVVLAALFWPLLAWTVFQRGIRRYSSGNKIGARL